MSTDVALDLKVAAVVAVVVLIVAVAAAASGACDCREEARAERAAADDVERALGEATLVAYARAAAAARVQQPCCVLCQSDYAKADELVRVVPACGHFFHAGCGVDKWIRARRTCPLCRSAVWPPRQERILTPQPRPEKDAAEVAAAVAV